MKILQVITSLCIGGAEKIITELVPAMIADGHQVDVLTFNGEDTYFKRSLEQKGIRIISFCNKRNYYNPIYIFRLIYVMRKYDIVHTHLTSPQFFCALANIITRKALITTEHSTYNRRRGSRFFSRVDRWMYSQYEAVICISEKVAENLVAFLGQKKINVVTIQNGINVKKYFDAPALGESKSVTGKTIITMVAAFRYEKDQETLIRAVKRLDESKYCLWLVGDGERHDELVEYIKSLKMDNRVRLWGNRDDVPSILKSSDIIVMSSRWEGFGLAAVEGMAAKKPVIASDVDGLAQIVQGAGLLFIPQNDEQLAQEIEKLSTDLSYYEMVANRCAARAMSYDISVMVRKYEDVYKTLS